MSEAIPDGTLLRDTLTGVYTRAAFELRLLEEIAAAKRLEAPLSILMLDLDHFKSINDGFGHARGDSVLAEFGLRLQESIRTNDLPFRYGGDEFVLLLPHSGLLQATVMAERLLKAVASRPFSGDPPLSLSISIGVAVFPTDGATADALLATADARAYQAKRAGRGQLVSKSLAQPDVSSPSEGVWLIGRDQARQTIRTFLARVDEQPRSILRIVGPPGSGRSSMLFEVGQTAEMYNQAVLHVRATAALGMRMYGALLEARHNLEQLPDPSLGTAVYAMALKQACKARLGADQSSSALVILIDDPVCLDRCSKEFLRRLFLLESMPHFAVAFTEADSPSVSAFPDSEPQTRLAISPLSPEEVQIWLRISLQWEAPEDFATWLHDQTGGLPARIQRGASYLIEARILQSVRGQWHCQPRFDRIPLAEILSKTPTPPCRLPLGLPLLVGRCADLQRLKERTRTQRLVTLVSPGGLGKSRLAVQLAAERLGEFPHGVFFVPLAGLRSADLLLTAITEVIQFTPSGHVEIKQQLLAYLQSRQVLLVLDNFEHLRDGGALLLDILEHAPGVCLLVTSRDPLGLPGESVFALDILSCPPTETAPQLESYEAVQLFLQAAPHAPPEGDELRHVARICRLVEGNPLALELAAAWTGVIPLSEIAAEIERSLSFLSTDRPDAEPRHRSLRAVFDSFWEVLTDLEQELLCRLAVFVGGFRREAARQVVRVSPLFLDAMVAKAYLRLAPPGRYEMHETLRQYATGKLAANPHLEVSARRGHAEFYLDLVQAIGESGSDDRLATDMVTEDLDNVRRAWTWASEHDQTDLLRKALDGMKSYYDTVGLWDEGRYVFEASARRAQTRMSATGQSAEDRDLWLCLRQVQGGFLKSLARFDEALAILRAVQTEWANLGNQAGASRALLEIGQVCRISGDLPAARGSLQDGLALARALRDQPTVIDALNNLAGVTFDQGDYHAARRLLEESLALSREAGRKSKTARVLNLLGNVSNEEGDFASARTFYSESLALFRDSGIKSGMMIVLNNLGNIESDDGNAAEAQRRFEESLALAREMGDKRCIAAALTNLGMLANEAGDLAGAQLLYNDALQAAHEAGDKRIMAALLDNLALLAIGRKDFPAAKAKYAECLTLAHDMGYKRIIVFALVGAAGLAMESEGLPRRAAQLSAAAEALKTANGIALDSSVQRLHERTLAAARAKLGETDLAACRTEGESLTMEQAVALAKQVVAGISDSR